MQVPIQMSSSKTNSLKANCETGKCRLV